MEQLYEISHFATVAVVIGKSIHWISAFVEAGGNFLIGPSIYAAVVTDGSLSS